MHASATARMPAHPHALALLGALAAALLERELRLCCGLLEGPSSNGLLSKRVEQWGLW